MGWTLKFPAGHRPAETGRRGVHLFRMGDQVDEMVSIAFDLEIETSPSVDSGLPEVAGLIELLCSEGRTAVGGARSACMPP
jgi:hypothetical protein